MKNTIIIYENIFKSAYERPENMFKRINWENNKKLKVIIY
jgi:hypothetical protein